MTFEPYEPRMFPLFIFYIGLSIFAIFFTIKMFLKYRERKTPPTLHLSIVFTCLTCAVIALIFGLAETIITGYKMYIYRVSLPLSMSLLVIADIFLFIFASQIAERERRALIPVIVIGVMLIIIIFLPFNYYGQPPEDYEGKLYIRLYTTLGYVIYSCIIYIFVIIICRNARKQATDEIARTGLLLLLYAALCMIGFLILQVFEGILIALFDHPGYSEYFYISWIFAGTFVVLSYLSLIMPDWLVKRIKGGEK
jgi:hypothetical protein